MLKIPVAHDFCCEWCWIGLFQAKRMQADYGARIEWLPYELYPPGLPQQTSSLVASEPENKPRTPSRLALAFAAAGTQPVTRKPVPTWKAHCVVEHAKTKSLTDEVVERIYHAYWVSQANIDDEKELAATVAPLLSEEEVQFAINSEPYRKSIVTFDDDAHANGIYNLPTFYIGDERLAEQPWARLQKALNKVYEREPNPDFYSSLIYPPSLNASRPYVAINMVTTIDGKIISGERGEPVQDLGSKIDHLMMRRIQLSMQGVLIGAGAQRSSASIWYPKELYRFVVTSSGNILSESRFFKDAPEKAFIISPDNAQISDVPAGVTIWRSGRDAVDWEEILSRIASELGIRRLLVEGGSEINAQLLERNLADELFLTLAPKIKLGEDVPTYADGNPLPRELIQNYSLIEQHRWQNELFMRYRRLR